MFQVIKLRRSPVPGHIPTATSIQLGELAINTSDGKLFLAKTGVTENEIVHVLTTNTYNNGNLNLGGNIILTGGTYSGDGSNLYNVPYSGISGSFSKTINGTTFDGTANIITSFWGTGRTITIGSSGKTVNGSSDVSWSLAEIGAFATPTGLTTNSIMKWSGSGLSNATGGDIATALNTAASDYYILNQYTTGQTGDFKITGQGYLSALQFNTGTTETGEIGKVLWNDTDGTLEFGMKGGNVTQQIGQELPILVKHADNSGLSEGSVVYVVGSDGSNKTVRYAKADAESTSSNTFGIMTESTTGGNKAFCTTFGMVRNINTSALTEGAAVYLSPTIAGGMTSTKPSAPNHMVLVGFCVRSHATVGSIFVKVQNGFELDELHDVAIGTLANNNLLAYESETSLWKNKTYSDLNIISGTGLTTNYLTKTIGLTLVNSLLYDDGNGIGIGTTSLTGIGFRNRKTITGAVFSYANYNDGIIQSGVTSGAFYHRTQAETVAASFTLPFLSHYHAGQGTIGSGSTVTNQFGFYADQNLIGASLNYGFFGNIPSGTNRWNLYMGGTANNYLAGPLGIGVNVPLSELHISSVAPIFSITATNLGSGLRLNILGQGTNTLAYRLQSLGTTIQAISTDGNMGIGNTYAVNANLTISKNIEGATTGYGINTTSIIQSGVTTDARIYQSLPNVVSGSTLPNLYHFIANPSTYTGVVTSQNGFYITGTFTGAVNNYGFRGLIPSGSGRWNIFMDGSADNYLAGSLGIGTTSLTGINLSISKNLTGSVNGFSIQNNPLIQSDVTSNVQVFRSVPSTQAASFVVGTLKHYEAAQGTIGSGSTITSQIGYNVDGGMTGATNNYGFYGNIEAGTNRWNLFMSGTADNYLAGSLAIGITVPLTKVHIKESSAYHIRIERTGVGAALLGISAQTSNSTGDMLFDMTQASQGYSFRTRNSANTTINALAIDRNGRIGNDALSPLLTLDVRIPTQYSRPSIGGVSADTTRWGYILNPINAGTSFDIVRSNNLSLRFATESGLGSGTFTTQMVLSESGNLTIGSSISGAASFSNSKIISGSIFSYANISSGAIQSDVTSAAWYYRTVASTQAATFTLSTLLHFHAAQGTFGSGSTVTVQTGYYSDNTLTGAAINYGFRGAIPSGSNRWNIYMDGTADNYLAGNLYIGSNAGTNSLIVSKNITGGIDASGIRSSGQIQTDVTNSAYNFRAVINQSSHALTFLIGYESQEGTISGTGTYAVNFRAQMSPSGYTNVFGFQSLINAGTNRYGLYLNGTANNYMNGSLGIGTLTPDASAFLQISSTTKGVLFPQMTTTQINAISSPANGLLVYNTTLNKLCIYESGSWKQMTTTTM